MNEQPELSAGARRVMMFAKKLAREYHHEFITTEHVLLSTLDSDRVPKSIKIMQSVHGIDTDAFRAFVISNLSKYKGPELPQLDQIEPSERLLKMLTYASCIAQEMESSHVDIDHLMLSILVSDSGSGNNIFKLKNIDVDKLYEDIYSKMITTKTKRKRRTKQRTGSGTNNDTEDDLTQRESILEKYAVNLTREAMADNIDPVIGREDDVYAVIEILSRRSKNNPVLIGEPGVGKTAIVELLAQRIAKQTVPFNLRNKQIYTVDLAQMVAGTIYRGQFEERLKEVITYAQNHPDVILFIDELHTLVGAGSTSGSMDASNILKPALARGKICCIGATTLQEYKEHVEGDGALERRFQSVLIEEPTSRDTTQILKGIKHKYEEFHNVKYTLAILTEIVRLCDRYIPDKNFPDKAIDMLDEAGARIKIARCDTEQLETTVHKLEQAINNKNRCVENQEFDTALGFRETEEHLTIELEQLILVQQQVEDNTAKPIKVTTDDIRQLVSDRSGVPVTALEQKEAERLKKLSTYMKHDVIGQDDGIDKICNAIKRNRAGVSDPNRPICSLLFLGPTGVGKTHLAKVLGEQMFHDGHFKQYDMSEFSERHSISKLIGSPPGYVGYGEGGELTEFVRLNPYSVLLFDEVEKAHPEVLQVFLQLLEYGKLTDSEGADVNFKNTIIILTSNIGAHKFEKMNSVGFASSDDDTTAGVLEELRKQYAPEFINRLDEIVVFQKLEPEHLKHVTTLLLKRLKKTLRRNTKIVMNFDDSLVDHLVDLNKDTAYGARPLRRLITEHVETALADRIIEDPNDIKSIFVSVRADVVKFDVIHSNQPTLLPLEITPDQ